MATLHIRNVPDEVCQRLRIIAKKERRSVNAEVVSLLVKVLDQGDDRPGVADLLRRAREIRSVAPKRRGGPSGLELLHRGRRERKQ